MSTYKYVFHIQKENYIIFQYILGNIYFFNKQKIVLATHFLIKKIICPFKSVIMMSKSQIHISHPHELT